MSQAGEAVEIECPGHGPMARVYALGALRLIQCRTCGKQPIDLLELAHIGSTSESGQS